MEYILVAPNMQLHDVLCRTFLLDNFSSTFYDTKLSL